AVNFIDASALETLKSLQRELRDAGVTLHLAAIKGPVMDRLRRVGFAEQIGAENVHLTTHEAMKAIGCFDDGGAEAQGLSQKDTEPRVTETAR
ncbi:MAG: STAS domain-containing protein, partial [Chloroflexota bacterium]